MKKIFCKLLSNGASTFHDLSDAQVSPRRAENTDWIDAEVVVETTVLDAENRLHQMIRQILPRYIREFQRPDTPQRRAVRRFEYQRRPA